MIYYKKTYFEDRKEGTVLCRVSSRIRGEEISEYLGNIKTNIYVKPRHLEEVKNGDYVDILDDPTYVERLKSRPNIKVIAMSLSHYD